MGKRPWAALGKRAVADLLAAAAVGIGIDRLFTNGEPNPLLLAAAISIAVLWAVQFGLSIVRALGGALYLWLLRGDDLEMIALDDLRQCKVPPRQYDARTFSYLLDIANDSSADPDERVRAAFMSATYEAVIKHAGFFGGLAWSEAADKAALRYAEETPRK